MTIAEAVEKFLIGYFGGSDRSTRTQSAYSFDLKQFKDFIGSEALLDSVDVEDLEAWTRHLQSRPYTPASIRRKFAAARMLFSYWVRRAVIKSSPMWRLRLSLGKEKALPRSLSPSDSRLLIEQVWREQDRIPVASKAMINARFLQARNVAMIETLFATGMRVGEVVKLRVSDWQAEDANFLVRGKGGRERLAFLPDDRSLRAVTEYLQLRTKVQASTDALFLNAMSKGISEQGVAMTLREVAKSAQIRKNVTPHMIRHTVATLLLRYGADIRIVQEVLGHASISTTQRYVHVAKDHLLATLRTRHPNHHLNVALGGDRKRRPQPIS